MAASRLGRLVALVVGASLVVVLVQVGFYKDEATTGVGDMFGQLAGDFRGQGSWKQRTEPREDVNESRRADDEYQELGKRFGPLETNTRSPDSLETGNPWSCCDGEDISAEDYMILQPVSSPRAGNQAEGVRDALMFAARFGCAAYVPSRSRVILEPVPELDHCRCLKPPADVQRTGTCRSRVMNSTQVSNTSWSNQTIRWWRDGKKPLNWPKRWSREAKNLGIAGWHKFLGLNKTHAMGEACPTEEKTVLKLRGGDIFNGNYRGGHYKSNWVHPKYWQPPLAFYMTVIKQQYGNTTVLCQDERNPVCKILGHMASARAMKIQYLHNVPMRRVIKEMYCSSTVVDATGTMRVIWSQSPRHRRSFRFRLTNASMAQVRQERCSGRVVTDLSQEGAFLVYGRSSTGTRLLPWYNSGEQRDAMMGKWEISVCRE
eukprot:TRINITY_DN13606_c0_g1_i6.p1 TRINITY_DN13606_c0_g1~~TRINITY_DN13606_c0_g1_i6.p1  ORF type:complete len:477 (-),score=19.09 TRINITY_DN13606_c0_g1_i6:269-1561(-)